jgi:hypothetical protein
MFPLFMFLFCAFRMRRGGMGCCRPFSRGFREATRRPSADRDDHGHASEPTTRSETKAEAERLKRTFERLTRRLQKLEDVVTAKEFDWDRRYKQP